MWTPLLVFLFQWFLSNIYFAFLLSTRQNIPLCLWFCFVFLLKRMINSTPKLPFWDLVNELSSLIGNDLSIIICILSLPKWLSIVCIALLAGLSPAWSEFVFVVPEISCVNAKNAEKAICWSTHDGCRIATPKCAKIPQSCKKAISLLLPRCLSLLLPREISHQHFLALHTNFLLPFSLCSLLWASVLR